MKVELRYFDGCPSWRVAEERLRSALDSTGHADTEIIRRRIETAAEAERLSFRGSPTILIDDRDPFGEAGGSCGLACRLYRTPEGLSGSPTRAQLEQVIP